MPSLTLILETFLQNILWLSPIGNLSNPLPYFQSTWISSFSLFFIFLTFAFHLRHHLASVFVIPLNRTLHLKSPMTLDEHHFLFTLSTLFLVFLFDVGFKTINFDFLRPMLSLSEKQFSNVMFFLTLLFFPAQIFLFYFSKKRETFPRHITHLKIQDSLLLAPLFLLHSTPGGSPLLAILTFTQFKNIRWAQSKNLLMFVLLFQIFLKSLQSETLFLSQFTTQTSSSIAIALLTVFLTSVFYDFFSDRLDRIPLGLFFALKTLFYLVISVYLIFNS